MLGINSNRLLPIFYNDEWTQSLIITIPITTITYNSDTKDSRIFLIVSGLLIDIEADIR